MALVWVRASSGEGGGLPAAAQVMTIWSTSECSEMGLGSFGILGWRGFGDHSAQIAGQPILAERLRIDLAADRLVGQTIAFGGL
jgi:hypothetical protein